jgi:hypothetical protein
MFSKIATGMISLSAEGAVKTVKQNLTLFMKLLFFFVGFFFGKQIFNIFSYGFGWCLWLFF